MPRDNATENTATERNRKTIEKFTLGQYVYFIQFYRPEGDVIYIGHSDGSKKQELARIAKHENDGGTLLAAIPGTLTNEKQLHSHFASHHVAVGTSRSRFAIRAVRPYVQALLINYYATPDPEFLRQIPHLPWAAWNPKTIVRKNRPGVFFGTPQREKSDDRDTWQSPAELFRLARLTFGRRPDLDPASELEAYLRPPEEDRPEAWFSKDIDGLKQSWFGTVFLNPPYGGDDARRFVEKACEEIESGHVTAIIMVLNAQSFHSKWFGDLIDRLDPSVAWSRKRVAFYGPAERGQKKSGTDRPTGNKRAPRRQYDASQNGTTYIYWGPNESQFIKVFNETARCFGRQRRP